MLKYFLMISKVNCSLREYLAKFSCKKFLYDFYFAYKIYLTAKIKQIMVFFFVVHLIL